MILDFVCQFLVKMTHFHRIVLSKSYFLLTYLACQFAKINLLFLDLITEPQRKTKDYCFLCSPEHTTFLRYMYEVLSSQWRYIYFISHL